MKIQPCQEWDGGGGLSPCSCKRVKFALCSECMPWDSEKKVRTGECRGHHPILPVPEARVVIFPMPGARWSGQKDKLKPKKPSAAAYRRVLAELVKAQRDPVRLPGAIKAAEKLLGES